jgi:glycosyltransferase involved in cell wall biosynthesis
VELTGRVDDTERLVSLYRSSDVFVFPSLYDTLGQVVLEAQRAGLPVVVRDQGGPPELVRHGETGFVTPDDATFVQRVEELVSDEELRRRMGRAARDHAESLPGWSDVIADLVGRLRALACGDPPAPPSAPDPSSSSERRASAV